ncbi:MAG: hypothetical protein P8Y71_25790 [Pseudolabrys sp.]
MTGKRKAPDGPQGRRKRAAPTIDLTATELPAGEDPKEEGEPEVAKADPPPEPEPAKEEKAEKAEAEEPAAQAETHAASVPAEEAQAAPSEPDEPNEPTKPSEPSEPPAGAAPVSHPGNVYLAAAAGGLVGAAVIAALVAGLWWGGVLPPNANAQRAQIAALQSQVKALQKRPAPAANGQAIEALRQTVQKLEADIAKMPRSSGASAGRLNAIDHAMDSLNVEIGKLNKRADSIAATAKQAQATAAKAENAVADLRGSVQHAASAASSAASPGQLDAVQKKIAALEDSLKAARQNLQQSLATTREQIAKQVNKQLANASATDKPARLALSAVALRQAVMSGKPYKAELAQAQSLGANEKELVPLQRFAAGGLPGKGQLADELHALIPALNKAAGTQKPPAGFLARLQANARNIVRINPVNAPEGDTPADVLARLEVDAAHHDIAAALADLDRLPAAARKPARDWIAKVKARQAAFAAARQFAAATARALGQK